MRNTAGPTVVPSIARQDFFEIQLHAMHLGAGDD